MSYTTKHYWGAGYIEEDSNPLNWSEEKLNEKADAWDERCKAYEEKVRYEFESIRYSIPLSSEPKSVKEMLGGSNRRISSILARASELGLCKKKGSKFSL